MRQFMCQEFLPLTGFRCILSITKHNIAADCVGQGVNRACRFGRLRIRMHAHAAKIMAEARLEKRASRRIKPLSRRAQHFMHDWRHATRVLGFEFRVSSSELPASSTRLRDLGNALKREMFLAAFATLATGNGVIAAVALAL